MPSKTKTNKKTSAECSSSMRKTVINAVLLGILGFAFGCAAAISYDTAVRYVPIDSRESESKYYYVDENGESVSISASESDKLVHNRLVAMTFIFGGLALIVLAGDFVYTKRALDSPDRKSKR